MRPLEARYLADRLFAGCIPLYLLAYLVQGTVGVILAIIGGILMVGGCVITVIFWRCTSCGKILPDNRRHKITHCPFCGNALDEDLDF